MSASKPKIRARAALALTVLIGAFGSQAVTAATDACGLLTAADYKTLGVTGVPKGRASETPRAAMRGCSAGNMLAPPYVSLTIQTIKQPMFVAMARKGMAADSAKALAGPWDVGKVESGVDGTLLAFIKGNHQVMVQSSGTDAATRAALTDIAKRVAGTL